MIWLGAGVFLCSCEKDLEQYSRTDYIGFINESAKDSVDYCFGLAGKTDRDRIGIVLKIAGEVCEYDRDFRLEVNTASSVHEGVHFEIAQAHHKIRAHRTSDTLWVDITNTPELKSQRLFLQLDLVENEHFRLCFPERSSCKIYLTDRILRPEWWDSWHETEGLGMYSEKKYRLFVRISGVADLGEEVAFPEKRAAILKFKYYLQDEALHNRTLMDEDQQPMRVAMNG